MAVYQSVLSSAGQTRSKFNNYFKRLSQPSAFLSHSHKDQSLALGLQALLQEQGWDVYIDWQDQTMPEVPDAETATKIKNAIISADWFLFLATENSASSRWCPWEIGFADGKKNHSRIAVIPTVDRNGKYYGNEYLALYNKIDSPTGSRALELYDLRGRSQSVRSL